MELFELRKVVTEILTSEGCQTTNIENLSDNELELVLKSGKSDFEIVSDLVDNDSRPIVIKDAGLGPRQGTQCKIINIEKYSHLWE